MNKNILSPAKRAEFEKLVRTTRYVDEKVRLCAILAYDEGHDIYDIANILKISESTAYSYINDYLTKNKIAHDAKGGSECKMSPMQEVELISHLHKITYLTAKEIVAYVFKTYEIKYTITGITKWLKRNDFIYKEPKKVPGKLDEQKQQAFVEDYNNLKQNIDSAKEIIMFMDAVHPAYQSQASCGWIPKGEVKTLATTNTQFRMHINGAIELNTMNVFTKEYKVINGESIISFLKDLEIEYPSKIIHLFCDNGPANKNKAVNQYLTT
jgi:transposase